ncbi:coumaroyl-CoA:anthocyanidin 3-O-glucoside-6''-O-coumaroyltransferase 2-like [Arachis stenosperma]|uniref:coumaroyl-CoA:anthocyanidin 3-O-glucoside-6''-O-coumaroyltransferase 2-like n=1 Tax=Arachis stenosperma TaxID=217475 RepID=UPI0025AB92CB|nr:coumaroyl-CoA:anthocyanidin 3-O-glucoside-6''-O-coumaroyltransferase 2-like [Arachis stenosperma]
MAQMENSSDNINKLVEHQFQVGVVASIENDAKINNKSFPLTFLDIPLAGPIYVKRLFFYKYPFSTNHFYQTTLPYLKRSLSLTLQSFFPLAGNLLCPPPPHKPFIQCTNEDSVAFTVVESSLDFNLLASNNPKSINDLRTLAPNLVGKAMHHDHDSGDDDTLVFPILALKATVFANRGVCIAINYCHVMDDRSCGQFMKSWSSLCGTIIRNGEEVESTLLDKYLPPPPCFDRGVLKDPKGLESIFLNDYFRERQSFKDKVVSQSQTGSLRAEEEEDYVKATIVFGRKEMEGMKRFALNELKKSNRSEAPQYLSSFVVTCAFLWSTLVKTKHRDEEENDAKEDCIRFAADVRERLEYPIAENYFGNCITRCHARLKRKELKGKDGFVNAARVIDKAVNDMKEEPFRGAENWKSTFIKLFVLGNSGLLVAGSHKFGVYDTDFGFGRPVKVEMLHSFRVMSIADTGDTEKGGIEFGMVFTKAEFQCFQHKLQQGLPVFA